MTDCPPDGVQLLPYHLLNKYSIAYGISLVGPQATILQIITNPWLTESSSKLKRIIGAAPSTLYQRLCHPRALYKSLHRRRTSLLLHTPLTQHPDSLKISSQPKGAPMGSDANTVIEDVIPVDTGMGKR